MNPTTVRQPTTELFARPRSFWELHREASLNWLAFGLLLAAWNAAGDEALGRDRRPTALRAYPCVSVRGAQRAQAVDSTMGD